MNATVGSIFCAMCMSACAPSQPSTAMVPYTEVVMKDDVERMESLHRFEIELCHKEKQITELASSGYALKLIGLINNQSAYIQSLTTNHTELVANLTEHINDIEVQKNELRADVRDLEAENMTLKILLTLLWVAGALYGLGKFFKWIGKTAPPLISSLGTRVHSNWTAVGNWFAWVGSCCMAICFAISKACVWTGLKLKSFTVSTGKLLGRVLTAIGTWLKYIVTYFVWGALLMTPLFLFRDYIPGMESFSFPTTWLDAVILAVRGFDFGSLLEVAVRLWAKKLEEPDEVRA
jgi:hypothetical protein